MKLYILNSYILGMFLALFLCVSATQANTFNQLKCYYMDPAYLKKHPDPIVTCLLNPSNGVENCDMGLKSYKMEANKGWPIIELYGRVKRVHYNLPPSIITGTWKLQKHYFNMSDCPGLFGPAEIKQLNQKWKNVWTLTATSLMQRYHRTLYLDCDLEPVRKIVDEDNGYKYNDLLPEVSLETVHGNGYDDSIFKKCPFKDDDLEIEPYVDPDSSNYPSSISSLGSSSSSGSSSGSGAPVTVNIENK